MKAQGTIPLTIAKFMPQIKIKSFQMKTKTQTIVVDLIQVFKKMINCKRPILII